MNKQEVYQLQEEIEKLKYFIKELYSKPETKSIAQALAANTNQYLHELLIKEMLRKDEQGDYVHQAEETDQLQQA